MKTISAIALISFQLIFMVFVFEVKAQEKKETEISWKSYAAVTEVSEMDQKKTMLFLEADWCTVCKRMHREVFTDKEVIALLNTHFIPVRMDIESDEMIKVKGYEVSKKEFSKRVGIYGTPTILFLDENEDIIGNFVGYSDENEMIKLLNFIHSEAYLNKTLDGYSYKP